MQRGCKIIMHGVSTPLVLYRDNFLEVMSYLAEFTLAMRPILEFDPNLEMYNHGDSNYGIATIAVAL